MLLRTLACTLSVVLLSACASTPRQPRTVASPNCAPRDAWERLRSGDTLDSRCSDEAYRQAARLARELGALEAQRAQLEASLAQLADDDTAAGQTRRRIRQVDVDIEAIRGVAVTRGLVDSVHELDNSEDGA